MSDSSQALVDLTADIIECRRCPRLVAWREETAREKRAAYRDENYWGKPVPGFGDPNARLVVVGLAPAAHGANRTGRMFTGDRSGDWLFRAMHRAGFANQPTSTRRGDGLELADAWVTAPVRCAPPGNRPTTDEREACSHWFDQELRLLRAVRVAVCLGGYGYRSMWSALRRRGTVMPSPRPEFGHGVRVAVDDLTLLLSYHPSQQNTFTKRLTESMFDAVFAAARAELGAGRDALG